MSKATSDFKHRDNNILMGKVVSITAAATAEEEQYVNTTELPVFLLVGWLSLFSTATLN